MQNEISSYLEQQKNNVKLKISDQLSIAVARTSFENYFSTKRSLAFQHYYMETISNKSLFLSEKDFFRKFKQQYALQGIDSEYLNHLERRKSELLELIETNKLPDLYFKYFASAPIKYKKEIRLRNLGSFFAKFVHTFNPEKFCALDNPIKKYFGLGNEGFYIAFLVISQSYREWSLENKEAMKTIRLELKNFTDSDMTDLKILDLIFWYQANRT